jgi:hypothetical protein
MTLLFPLDPLVVMVELYYSGAWHDLTAAGYCRMDDDQYGVAIERGRDDEASRPDPSVCRVMINNLDGRFSPRNPRSPLYGLIGRNTPLRVRVNNAGNIYVRFVGEVSNWPARWETSGLDVWVNIEASGITRRLGANAGVLRSAFRRAMDTYAGLAGYWPMEDGVGATQLASGISGHPAMMLISGASDVGSADALDASAPLPAIGTGLWQADVPTYTTTGQTQIRLIAALPSALPSADTQILAVSGTGSVARWSVVWTTGAGELNIKAYGTDGTLLLNSVLAGSTLDATFGAWRLSLELTQSGADVNWKVATLVENQTGSVAYTGTLVGATVGRITRLKIGDATPDGLAGGAIGHLAISTATTFILDLVDAFNANRDENAWVRAARLCTENSIPYDGLATPANTNSQVFRMGSQRVKTFLDLMDEIRDLGLWIGDNRESAGLWIIAQEWRTTQDVIFSRPYSILSPPLEPAEDDQHLANDVTVTRDQGGSARVTVTSGPLSTQAPPDGAGIYAASRTMNLYSDDLCKWHAQWLAALGTADEARYPALTIDLLSAPAPYDLVGDVASILENEAIEITNLPTWLPGSPLRLMIEGYAERIGPWGWIITFNTTPATPSRAWVVEDATMGHIDTAGATTSGSFAAGSATSLTVATTTGPLFITTAGHPSEFPFDIMVSGVRLHVTAVTGATSPQTFTVSATPVNGVSKTIPSGSAVHVVTGVVAL